MINPWADNYEIGAGLAAKQQPKAMRRRRG